jgi:hypothetical protein
MSHNHCDENECCESHGSCCCHHHHHHNDDESHDGHFSKQLLELADEAWMEVLKEKIKEKIIASSGGHLDKLAALVTETNHMRWNNKMTADRACEDFKKKLCDLFHQK